MEEKSKIRNIARDNAKSAKAKSSFLEILILLEIGELGFRPRHSMAAQILSDLSIARKNSDPKIPLQCFNFKAPDFGARRE